MTIAERKQKIHDLVAELGVETYYDVPLRGAHCIMHGTIELHVTALHLPKDQDDVLSFWCSLHEIGHAKTWDEYGVTARGLRIKNRQCLAAEAAAWEWALDNAGVEPTAEAWDFIRSTLGSYMSYSYNLEDELPITRRIWGAVLARAK